MIVQNRKIITNNLKSKINILSKFFFKKEFPENLYWFSTENDKPDAQSLFHNFNEYFGVVGFIPKLTENKFLTITDFSFTFLLHFLFLILLFFLSFFSF